MVGTTGVALEGNDDERAERLEVHRDTVSTMSSLPAAMRCRRLTEQLKLFGNELLHHFAREEEGLVPYIRENVLAKAHTVDRLVDGHDLICGAIVPLLQLVDSEAAADLATLVGHFERFEAAYARHSQAETALLRSWGQCSARASARRWLSSFGGCSASVPSRVTTPAPRSSHRPNDSRLPPRRQRLGAS
jgi:hypothetical protein